jgi:hypothetical protein
MDWVRLGLAVLAAAILFGLVIGATYLVTEHTRIFFGLVLAGLFVAVVGIAWNLLGE